MKVFKCQEELDNIEVQCQSRVNSLLTHPFQPVMTLFLKIFKCEEELDNFDVVSIKSYSKYKTNLMMVIV